MKKVLSIVLSVVMVLCMMPVMAFADTAVTFTDANDIEHSEAVYSLAALDIIDGYTDGTYKPAKTVTRAEMSKIIATLLNGGTAPVVGTAATYTDTQGHWAAGYIEYCNSLGIVAGVGEGKFNPDATVTAEQAAKMLLIAQGYNADVEGLVGAGWDSNTNVLANQNGYYTDLTDIVTAAGLTREHAAQMVYNVFDAEVIVKQNSVNKETGVVTTSYYPGGELVAAKYLGLKDYAGVISEITYDKKDAVYVYTVGDTTFKSATDYTALFGQNVKVLYKVEKSKTVVYGMFADESSVAYTGVWGDIDASTLKADKKTVKINGTVYKLNTGAIPTPAAEYDLDAVTSGPAAYVEIKAIDAEDDGDIDSIVYSPLYVTKVTYVGKTQFTVEAGGTQNFEDVIVYDGIAKNDFVAVTTDLKTGDKAFTKIETLKDVKATSTKGKNVTINGTSYKNLAGLTAGAEYDAVGILNGYAVIASSASVKADVTKYAVVTGKKMTSDYDNAYTVRILTSAGTEVEAPVKAAAYNSVKVGDFVKFKADDKYTFEQAAAVTNSGFDAKTTGAFTKKTDDAAAKIGGYGIAADAVIFVATTNDDGDTTYSVIKGSDLAAKTEAANKLAFIADDKATGFSNVALAYVGQAATTSDSYAYVTDDCVTNVDADGVTTYTVTLSTGTFETKSSVSVAGVVKGAIVSYTVDTENKIKAIKVVGAAATALTAYDGTVYKFADSAATYKLADKATTMYIDSEAKTVAEGGAIALADKDADGKYINNVKYVLDSKGEKIELLVVDVNNKMA